MMQLLDKSLQNEHSLQNLSAIDRTIRIVLGAVLIGSWLVVEIASVNLWFALMPLFGAAIMFTGILGWDPLYALFSTKSCDVDDHNRCGTLPFQISRLFKK